MRGDVLLYHDSGPIARLIQWRTGGIYNHVAVDLDGEYAIAAVESGIRRVPLGDYAVRAYIPSSAHKDAALRWLVDQVGSTYGWADIVDDVLPSWLPLRPLLGQAHAYDCSDLVARYLDLAGVLPLTELGGDAKTVTPNDLARAFRKRGWFS